MLSNNLYFNSSPTYHYWNSRKSFPHDTLMKYYNASSNESYSTSRTDTPFDVHNDNFSLDLLISIISENITNDDATTNTESNSNDNGANSLNSISSYHSHLILSRLIDDTISNCKHSSDSIHPPYINTYEFRECAAHIYLGNNFMRLNSKSNDVQISEYYYCGISTLYNLLISCSSSHSQLTYTRDFSEIESSFLRSVVSNCNQFQLFRLSSERDLGHNNGYYINVSSSHIDFTESIQDYAAIRMHNYFNGRYDNNSISNRINRVTYKYSDQRFSWSNRIREVVEYDGSNFTKIVSHMPYSEVNTYEFVSFQLDISPSMGEMVRFFRSFCLVPECGKIAEEFIFRYGNFKLFCLFIIYSYIHTDAPYATLHECTLQCQGIFLNNLFKIMLHYGYPLNLMNYLNGIPFYLNSCLMKDGHEQSLWDSIPSNSEFDHLCDWSEGNELFNHYIATFSRNSATVYDGNMAISSNGLISENYLQDHGVPLYLNSDSVIHPVSGEYLIYTNGENPKGIIKYNKQMQNCILINHQNLVNIYSESNENDRQMAFERIRNIEESKDLPNEEITQDMFLRKYLLDYRPDKELESGAHEVTLTCNLVNNFRVQNLNSLFQLDGMDYYLIVKEEIQSNLNSYSIQPWIMQDIKSEDNKRNNDNDIVTTLHDSIISCNSNEFITTLATISKREYNNIKEYSNIRSLTARYSNRNDAISEYNISGQANEVFGILVVSAQLGNFKFSSTYIKFEEDSREFSIISNSIRTNVYTAESTGNKFNYNFEEFNQDLAISNEITAVHGSLKRIYENIIKIICCNYLDSTIDEASNTKECRTKDSVFNKEIVTCIDSASIVQVLKSYKAEPFTSYEYLIASVALSFNEDGNKNINDNIKFTTNVTLTNELANSQWTGNDGSINMVMSKLMKFAQFINKLVNMGNLS